MTVVPLFENVLAPAMRATGLDLHLRWTVGSVTSLLGCGARPLREQEPSRRYYLTVQLVMHLRNL